MKAKSMPVTLKNYRGVIELLIDQRNKARERRDFAASDEIRDQLLELGIQLKDSKDGTTFSLL